MDTWGREWSLGQLRILDFIQSQWEPLKALKTGSDVLVGLYFAEISDSYVEKGTGNRDLQRCMVTCLIWTVV